MANSTFCKMRVIGWLVVSVISGVLISVIMAYELASARDFEIGDLGGFFYIRIFAPVLGVFIAIIAFGISLRCRFSPAKGFVMAILSCLVGSMVIHFAALETNKIGGWYRLPPGYDLNSVPDAELLTLANDENREIAESAWLEWLRRGRQQPDLLVEFLSSQKKIYGNGFVENPIVMGAAATLADMKDSRAIPFLEDLLGAQKKSKVYDKGKTYYLFTHRKMASTLLQSQFGIHTDTQITQELTPSKNETK